MKTSLRQFHPAVQKKVLSLFCRNDLRAYAAKHDIHRGKDKASTINNIVASDAKLCVRATMRRKA